MMSKQKEPRNKQKSAQVNPSRRCPNNRAKGSSCAKSNQEMRKEAREADDVGAEEGLSWSLTVAGNWQTAGDIRGQKFREGGEALNL
jgi:hypothetical protein